MRFEEDCFFCYFGSFYQSAGLDYVFRCFQMFSDVFRCFQMFIIFQMFQILEPAISSRNSPKFAI